MFRVLACRFMAVLALVFGVFALSGAAGAQSLDRITYGYQATERAVQVQPRLKKRVYAGPSRKAKALAQARRLKAQRIARQKMIAARK